MKSYLKEKNNMADLMKKLKTGKLSALSQQTIQPFEDYEVTDVAEGGITNAQMTLALDESAGSFFKIGSVYLCIDEGTYTKHCFYKWNGIDASTPWEVVGSFANKQDKLTAGENITINENNVISSTASGNKLYRHDITLGISSNSHNCQIVLITNSQSTFGSITELATYLYNNGYKRMICTGTASTNGNKLYIPKMLFVTGQQSFTIYATEIRFSTDGSDISMSYSDNVGGGFGYLTMNYISQETVIEL